jgi:hypothetical protein
LSITLLHWTFDGPFMTSNFLKDQSGVYVILRSENSSYSIIDVGESENVKSRVSNHDRFDCWQSNRASHCCVYYAKEIERLSIEKEIRNNYPGIPCGLH